MSAVLALLSSLLWGTSDFLGGTLSRRMSERVVVGGSQLLGFLGLLPIAAATGGFAAGPGYLGWSVGAGFVGVAALLAFYRALAIGTMGVVAPIAATGAAVPVVVGLASGESPAPVQLAGVVLAVVGVVGASGPQLRAGTLRAAPLLLAGAAAAGFGLVLVFVARGSETSVVMTLLTMRGVSAGTLGFAMLAAVARRDRGERRERRPGTRDLPLLGLIGGFDATANGTYAVASQSGLVSVTAVLASLYPAVTALWARQVHGERLRPAQLWGIGGVLAGTVLLAAG